ncbi:MAG: hypothetical protein ACTSXO_08925 [Candidatus Heimdallarchaeota archaeon]
MNDEEFALSSEIAQALINKAALEKGFHRRITAKIFQNEVKAIKKRFNTISLSVIGVLVILASILIILQIQLILFTSEIAIPIILLGLTVIVGGVFALDYFYVHSKGDTLLEKHLGAVTIWEQKLKELQRQNTRVYNHIKKAFDSILPVDSKFILNAFILRYYVTSLKEEEQPIPLERLYKLLLLLSSKKNIDLKKRLKNKEEEAVLREQLTPYCQKARLILEQLLKQTPLPQFFRFNILSAQQALESFLSGPPKRK